MKFTPHTKEDITKALQVIGVKSLDELFNDLPAKIQNPNMDVPAGLDEAGLLAALKAISQKNKNDGPNFLGGGVRNHFSPSVVNALTFQSEFVTAYTPYQPEVSQGLLQAMFEYQSMICELTAMHASNSSLYDGATAVAEAALLAMRHTGRNTIVVSRGVHPEYRETLQTFLAALDTKLVVLDLETGEQWGRTPSNNLPITEDVAAVIVQNPNYFGALEPMDAICASTQAAGALMVAVADPLSLAVIRPPGEYGADIAVGDGQVLGNAPNFGGPHYGFIAVKENLLRQLPGRLVGATKDSDGRRGFVLTLQAREQHIRRAKAKSNICSNHALMALQSAIHIAALGPNGLREVAIASAVCANQLRKALLEMGLVCLPGNIFAELVVQLPKPAAFVRAELAKRGVHACVPVPAEYGLGNAGLFACTEQTMHADIEMLVAALKEVLV